MFVHIEPLFCGKTRFLQQVSDKTQDNGSLYAQMKTYSRHKKLKAIGYLFDPEPYNLTKYRTRHKKCAVCGKGFYDNSINYIKETCSPKCRLEYYYQRYPDKWVERHIQMRAWHWDKWGLDVAAAMETTRGDSVCAICGTRTDRMALDHDHATGNIRGILCSRCNVALGLVGDNIGVLEKMIAYLKSKSIS